MKISYGLKIKRIIIFALGIAIGAQTSLAINAPLVRTSSDLRSVAVCYHLASEKIDYQPEQFQEIQDLLRVFAEKLELTHASLFINFADLKHIDQPLPKNIGQLNE